LFVKITIDIDLKNIEVDCHTEGVDEIDKRILEEFTKDLRRLSEKIVEFLSYPKDQDVRMLLHRDYYVRKAYGILLTSGAKGAIDTIVNEYKNRKLSKKVSMAIEYLRRLPRTERIKIGNAFMNIVDVRILRPLVESYCRVMVVRSGCSLNFQLDPISVYNIIKRGYFTEEEYSKIKTVTLRIGNRAISITGDKARMFLEMFINSDINPREAIILL